MKLSESLRERWGALKNSITHTGITPVSRMAVQREIHNAFVYSDMGTTI